MTDETTRIIRDLDVPALAAANGQPDEDIPFPEPKPAAPGPPSRLLDGAAFILDEPADVPAVWGRGGAVAWSAGEPLMIVGPQGVGKTTLAQRLVLARISLASAAVGFPVAPDERRVLYIAADRPRQAKRSFRRMVSEEEREILRTRLVTWSGPLPFSLVDNPTGLATWAESLEVGTVFIDSYKDVALDLSSEETGARVNFAMQELVARDIESCGLHHQRKAQASNPKPKTLGDVYGSGWLTAGCGSVLLLWGEAGDVLVELSHLKQPAEEIGPWTISIDHETGALTVHEATEAADLLTLYPAGVTARDAAATLTGRTNPSRSDIEKARRKLEKLVGEGIARRLDPDPANPAARYVERLERDARA